MTDVLDADCTICGRSIPSGEWARFRVEETEVGRHVIVACALHTDEEIASSWHYDDAGNEDHNATEYPEANNMEQQELPEASDERQT